ncbi:uncharacterized protein [Ptychodera flava]|uniref:uncharacterized protein n=1 Tax=Ptychodera flava TaxID=63121 RepID=UPI00396A0166
MYTPRKKLRFSDDTQTPSTSTASQDEEYINIRGYPHNVSSLRQSPKMKGRYFNFTLQTGRHEYHETVCFVTEKHQTISNAAQTKTPVSLKSVTKAVAQTTTTSENEQFDVKINRKATILPVNKKTLQFQHRQPPSLQELTITDVLNTSLTDQAVTVRAKVTSNAVAELKTARDGTQLTLTKYIVSDKTGSIEANTWGNTTLQLHQSYLFEYLITKSFADTKNVQIGSRTVITPIDDIGDIIETPKEQPVVDTITGTVRSIKAILMSHCTNCKRPVEPLHSQIVRCTACDMKQASTSLSQNMQVTLQITGCSNTFTISHNVIDEFLQISKKQNLLTDAEDLEDYFLISAQNLLLEHTPTFHVTSITSLPPSPKT